MNKLILSALLLSAPVFGGDFESTPTPDSTKLFTSSVFALAGSTAFDAYSSRGLQETNPTVGRGTFGTSQTLTMVGITGGLLVAEYFITRHAPRTKKVFAIFNFVGSGAHVAVGFHNESVRGR